MEEALGGRLIWKAQKDEALVLFVEARDVALDLVQRKRGLWGAAFLHVLSPPS